MLNYDANTYLAVTLYSSSPYFFNPSTLASVHPAVAYVGQVGEMHDIQLFSVPKQDWTSIQDDLMASLKAMEGVSRVDIQAPRARAKRGADEL